uniref:Uncharacterized protein n=1 Tax=Capra hircus TaxID=9925 RepID=A0A8C2RGR0_CAPHI
MQGDAEPRAGAQADAVHTLVRRGALLHQPREAAAVFRDPGPHAGGRRALGPAHGGPEQRASLPAPARLLRPPGPRLHQPGGGAPLPGRAQRPHAREPPRLPHLRARQLRREWGHPEPAGVHGPQRGPGRPAAAQVLAQRLGPPAAPEVQQPLLLQLQPLPCHPQLPAPLQPGAERRGRGGGCHRPAGLPEAPDTGPAAQHPDGLGAGEHRPAVPAAPVALAGAPGLDGQGGLHVWPLGHAEALQAAEGPQVGAALLQRQRPVLPGAEPVLRAAAPLPGVAQRDAAARGRAGLHGALPARGGMPSVHWRIAQHLPQPAAGPPPQFPGGAAGAERRRLPPAPRGPDRRDPGRTHGAPG